ncbi:MAG: UbiA family prenyltransferase [Chitinophagales bacterium]|nr:UbiA family prenyltransferase [Chitinophagales bacterium]MDW8393357.1 UbiA family prenyltransferase [Chitinophagales bacterium]
MQTRQLLLDVLYQQSMRLINVLLFGNLFIALCGAACTAATSLQLGTGDYEHAPVAFVFFSTLGVYNLHALLGRRQPVGEVVEPWVRAHRFHILLLCIIGFGGAAVFFFQLSVAAQVLAISLGVVVAGYVLPVFHPLRQRILTSRFGLMKSFVVAGVWTLLTVWLPLWQAEKETSLLQAVLLLAQRFCWLSMLSLCFDTRDQNADERNQVLTLPVRYGPSGTAYMYRLLAAAATVLTVVTYVILYWNLAVALPLLTSVVLSYGIVRRANRQQSPYYYLLLVDGQMLVQWLLLFFGAQIR